VTIVYDEPEVGFTQTIPEEPQTQTSVEKPSFGETVQAAFELENTLVGAAANGFQFGNDYIPEEGYNPMNDIEGYELYAESFIDSRSLEETNALKTKITREIDNRKIVADSGVAGFVSMLGAGITDPVYWPLMMTGLGEIKTTRSAAKAFGQSFAVGATSEIPAEILKHGIQETRTISESAINIGGSAVLGGLLGAGINKLKVNAKDAGINTVDLEKKLEDMVNSDSPELSHGNSLSMGAAETVRLTPEESELVGALGLERWGVSPDIRTKASRSHQTRMISSEMMESALVIKGNKLGKTAVPEGGSLETRIKRWDGALADGIIAHKSGYKKYLKRMKSENSKPISYFDFRGLVSRAGRRNDTWSIPEVSEAAATIRKSTLDPLKEAAIDVGIFSRDVATTTAPSYLTRVYRSARIKARRPEWDGIVDNYFRTVRDRSRSEYDRVIGTGREPSEELRNIALMEDYEITAARNEITDKILGISSGRSGYDIVQLERGPLRERTFNIDDFLIEDFLENDIDIVLHSYVKTMSSDVELNRMYGSVTMSDQIDAIKRSYSDMEVTPDRRVRDAILGRDDAATIESKRKRLSEEMKNDIDDIEAMRDRLRGTYKVPTDPDAFFSSVGRRLRSVNFMRMLGGVTLSAIPDSAGLVAVNGLRPFFKAFKAMGVSPKKYKLSVDEGRQLAAALDMTLNSRAMSLAELTDSYQTSSVIDRSLAGASNVFSKATLMPQWNTAWKQVGSVMASHKILSESINWQSGNISKSARTRMAVSGIDEEMAGRIADQYKKYAALDNDLDATDLMLSRADKWDDIGAAESFKSAVLRDVDKAIITPGQGEAPLWASSEMGKVAFQFKSFASAAHHKILISNLQYHDAQAAQGLLMMTALGYLAYAAKQYVSNRDISDNQAQVIIESLDRSGAFGYFWDINNIAAKMTSGKVSVESIFGGEPLSRYQSRNIIGALAGPSLGTIEDVRSIIGDVSSGEADEKTLHKVRTMLPGQNLFYIRQILDELEKEL
jgi:uncharacterized protein (UPF0297 family)